jgi:hypothetical protein
MNNISMVKSTHSGLSKSTTSLKRWNTSNMTTFGTCEDRNKYYAGLEKKVGQNFKEREKEIIARLKQQPKPVKKKFKEVREGKPRQYDETYFFDKEMKMLELREHYNKRSLTPSAYDGYYKNLYKV